jgi:cation:H+ antiporter
MIYFQLLACAAVIFIAGYKLCYYSDIIAEKIGLGRTWVGVVLLASTTSLPELMTGISSVALADVPNIAAGDALGSCVFNILIIALLDLMSGKLPLSARAHQGQVLTAGLGIFMLGLVAISLDVGGRMPSFGWVGVNSVVLLLLYLAAMRMVFTYEKRRIAEFVATVQDTLHTDISTSRAGAMYALNAIFIVGAATYLPYVGEEIARTTDLGQTFVGSVLIAISTSLPEVVVSLSALRMGAVDMAFGNVFGSNLFNIAILGIDDLFYTKGVLTSHISSSHSIPAITAITMTAIAIVGLTYRATRKQLLLAWDSLAIIAVYLYGLLALYLDSTANS